MADDDARPPAPPAPAPAARPIPPALLWKPVGLADPPPYRESPVYRREREMSRNSAKHRPPAGPLAGCLLLAGGAVFLSLVIVHPGPLLIFPLLLAPFPARLAGVRRGLAISRRHLEPGALEQLRVSPLPPDEIFEDLYAAASAPFEWPEARRGAFTLAAFGFGAAVMGALFLMTDLAVVYLPLYLGGATAITVLWVQSALGLGIRRGLLAGLVRRGGEAETLAASLFSTLAEDAMRLAAALLTGAAVVSIAWIPWEPRRFPFLILGMLPFALAGVDLAFMRSLYERRYRIAAARWRRWFE